MFGVLTDHLFITATVGIPKGDHYRLYNGLLQIFHYLLQTLNLNSNNAIESVFNIYTYVLRSCTLTYRYFQKVIVVGRARYGVDIVKQSVPNLKHKMNDAPVQKHKHIR